MSPGIVFSSFERGWDLRRGRREVEGGNSIALGPSHFSLLSLPGVSSLQVSSHSWRSRSLQLIWMVLAFDFISTAFECLHGLLLLWICKLLLHVWKSHRNLEIGHSESCFTVLHSFDLCESSVWILTDQENCFWKKYRFIDREVSCLP